MSALRWLLSPDGSLILTGCLLILWCWIDDARTAR